MRPGGDPGARVGGTGSDEATLREVIEALAPLERRAGSDGERQAADWIAQRLRAAGCQAEVEPEEYREGYARVMRTLSITSGLAGAAALAHRRARPLAGAVAGAVTAAIADDVSNGPRLFRRAASPARTTWNTVGSIGAADAPRTLVLLAHHDAAPTGKIFDDTFQRWLGETFPGIIERIDTSLPLWWTLMTAPGLVALGSLRGRRGLIAAGLAGSALATAVFEDVVRSPIVPGANDNLTAVAVLVALAERLRAAPVDGLRIVLASCGAEEVIQGGIYGFARRHFPALDRERTWFINLETVGSPRLIMLEGEGPVVMEDYHHRAFRDLIARVADQVGAHMRRGMRSRNSTDAVLPSRAGYPTATLASMNRHKQLSNYHLMSDTPENVDYRTVRQALVLTEAVARELAANPWI
ncbi:MAG TPA: M28 family peptidase [Solirubrobacteraceae bacterium]|nr:M28 family peptidase [Solirubrobacteraceae bacterium]